MNKSQAKKYLQKAVNAAGGATNLAKQVGLSRSWVYKVIREGFSKEEIREPAQIDILMQQVELYRPLKIQRGQEFNVKRNRLIEASKVLKKVK